MATDRPLIELSSLDWGIIASALLISLIIGIYVAKQAGKDGSSFFLGNRSMPWWLLGFSMVATTFSTDTPNLVTDLVRQGGVAGNWVWWAQLLTGMLTVFVYARLWRRSAVSTDVEFYELRYSGKAAAFLRGFRALYLGIFFNVMVMGGVSLAAIKIGAVTLGLEPWQSLLYAWLATTVLSTLGGFRGVLLTDFLLFIMAMVGSVAAAYFALGHEAVGGLSGLLHQFNTHPELQGMLDIFPSATVSAEGIADYSPVIGLLIVPLTVQWWSTYYPGAEPGGGGYLAQRMLAAKNEKHALGAVLFFNVAHYALRPWPWILVALASMVIYPNLESLQTAFPHIAADKVGHDLAYSAMLFTVPTGWLGIIMASLVAAFMSTISTHLNWGSSYLVNDFYLRFVKPSATPKEQVLIGRLCTVALMGLTAAVALVLTNAQQIFGILLQVGAGTGLLFILRWFWWRINAISEITAMVVSLLVAATLSAWDNFGLNTWQALILSVGITTACWVVATLLTAPTDSRVLIDFVQKVNPGGPGWDKVKAMAREQGRPLDLGEPDSLPRGIAGMVLGCMTVYGLLLGGGYCLYGNYGPGLLGLAVACVAGATVAKLFLGRASSPEPAAK